MQTITRSADERERLEQAARSTRDKRVWLRIRALLLWDEGRSATEVARTMNLSRESLYRWRQQYLPRRDPTDLLDRPKSGRPPKLAEPERKRLDEILQQEPAQFGYRSHGWSVPLLLRHLKNQQGVSLSQTTLRRTLRSLGYRWKRPRYVLARRDPEREGKKGGTA